MEMDRKQEVYNPIQITEDSSKVEIERKQEVYMRESDYSSINKTGHMEEQDGYPNPSTENARVSSGSPQDGKNNAENVLSGKEELVPSWQNVLGTLALA